MASLHATIVTAGLCALLFVTSPSGISEANEAGAIILQHPWARAAPPGAKVGGGYVTVVNAGTVADRLIGGSLDGAGPIEFHETRMNGAQVTMRRLEKIDIPPMSSISFAPLGKHLMFTGLKNGLTKGQHVSGTLLFEKAGAVKVEFDIEAIGAAGPSSQGQGEKRMPGMNMN
jgi:periplasmic copper chaperone A